jgi:hypothetical protein
VERLPPRAQVGRGRGVGLLHCAGA